MNIHNQTLLKRAKTMQHVYSIEMLITTIRPYSKEYVCVYEVKCTVNM